VEAFKESADLALIFVFSIIQSRKYLYSSNWSPQKLTQVNQSIKFF